MAAAASYGRPCISLLRAVQKRPQNRFGARGRRDAVFRRFDPWVASLPLTRTSAQAHIAMKLSIALLAAPAVAFAPQAQQAASVKLEAHKEVAAATLAAGALLAPFAAFAGDIESGETLFAGNCAACHAGGNNVIAAEKTLRKDALDKYLAGGRKESSVVTQVTNGKNAMPAFGGRLSDEEIGDVAAYVIDQANGDKWDD